MQDRCEKENPQSQRKGPERFRSKPGSSVTPIPEKSRTLGTGLDRNFKQATSKVPGVRISIKSGRRFDACEPYYLLSNIIRTVLFV
jgi:hypothetical protein